MIFIQKKHLYGAVLTLCFIQQQHAMDTKPNQPITWAEFAHKQLNSFAQRSEYSYADIRQSYAQLGQKKNTNGQPVKTTEKK